jgi:hypothetical protein
MVLPGLRRIDSSKATRDSVITDKSNQVVHPSVTSVPDLDTIRKIMVLAGHSIREQM